VLDLIRLGFNNEKIGVALDISPATAKFYVYSIMQRYDLSTRYGLLAPQENDYVIYAVDNPLTRREREVLKLLLQGKDIQESSQILVTSPRTVQTHRYNILTKIRGVLQENSTCDVEQIQCGELYRIALSNGWHE